MNLTPQQSQALRETGFISYLADAIGVLREIQAERPALDAMPAIPAPSPVRLSMKRATRKKRVLQT